MGEWLSRELPAQERGAAAWQDGSERGAAQRVTAQGTLPLPGTARPPPRIIKSKYDHF